MNLVSFFGSLKLRSEMRSLKCHYDTRLDLKNNINSDPKSFREQGFRSMSKLTRLNTQSIIRVLFLTQMEA